ncbi:MAG: hypothetical protein ACE5K9_07495 [Candidatus Methylomirabilales bacterium]
MTERGWRGYTEHEFQMALFVGDNIFQHYGVTEEDRAEMSETLFLLAIYHLKDEGRIVLKADLQELFPGFPFGLPDQRQAEEIAREHMQKYDISQPLKELLFAVLLVEITSTLVSEKKLIWLAPPSGRRSRG